MSTDQPQTPSTLQAVPAAATDPPEARERPARETDPKILLQRQGERRREAERKLALHIQQYRQTHPLAPRE